MSALGRKYADLWREAEGALREGSYTADTLPSHGDPRWGLSVVVAVEGGVRERVAADLGPIARGLSPHHFVYGPAGLHSTVRSCEGYQDAVPAGQLAHYTMRVRQSLDGCPPIRIALRGLGGSRGGLFVRGYPSEGLAVLRARLHDWAVLDGPRAFPTSDYAKVRDTAHVSLAVFRSPVVPEAVIGDVVAGRADKEYGTVEASSLRIVRYRLGPGGIRMDTLAGVPVGEPRPGR